MGNNLGKNAKNELSHEFLKNPAITKVKFQKVSCLILRILSNGEFM